MAVTAYPSLRFRYMLATGQINFATDVFKVVLMDASAFVFDPVQHATLSNIQSLELATAYGYTRDERVLSGVLIAQGATNASPYSSVVWNDAIWLASGGTIGPANAACIYDDTVTEKTVIGAIVSDLWVTATDGNSLTLVAPRVII